MRSLLLGLLLLSPFGASTAHAQRPFSWEEFVEYLVGSEEDADDADGEGAQRTNWTDYLDELSELHQNPINLNTATRQELQAIPLLSERQILQLIQYVDYHHGMHSLSELLLIPSISFQERRILPLFLYVDDTKIGSVATDSVSHSFWNTLRSSFSDVQQELGSRMDIPLYHRRGYLVDGGYLGSPLYNKVYYRLSASHRVAVGLHLERDAGERGIDSHGGYLMLRDLPLGLGRRSSAGTLGKEGRDISAASESEGRRSSASIPKKENPTDEAPCMLNRLIVGDYRVSFGLGLVLNQAFSMGKNYANLHSLSGLRPLDGTDEFNFMRGIATSLSFRDLTLSLFYSHRQWDATLTTPSSSDEKVVKTVVKSGYHRTLGERDKKGMLGVDVCGGNVQWTRSGMQLGVSGYFMKTDKELVPGDALYRRYYPAGRRFAAVGVNYGYDAYRWRFFGEVAYHKGVALLNGLSWRLSSRYQVSVLQRYYNKRYHSFFSSALAENGAVQNETGGMLRLEAKPLDGLEVTAYVDLFRSPWARYGVNKSSKGWDAVLEARMEVSRTNSLSLRYQAKRKEQSKGSILHHKCQILWTNNSFGRVRLATKALLHALPGSVGEALGETVRWQLGRVEKRWTLALSALYFHTDDYDSRVYGYEPNLTGTMSVPAFSGHGIRTSGLLQARFFRERVRVELKYGLTYYFDRKVQGSALQTIYSPAKNDVSLHVKVRI